MESSADMDNTAIARPSSCKRVTRATRRRPPSPEVGRTPTPPPSRRIQVPVERGSPVVALGERVPHRQGDVRAFLDQKRKRHSPATPKAARSPEREVRRSTRIRPTPVEGSPILEVRVEGERGNPVVALGERVPHRQRDIKAYLDKTRKREERLSVSSFEQLNCGVEALVKKLETGLQNGEQTPSMDMMACQMIERNEVEELKARIARQWKAERIKDSNSKYSPQTMILQLQSYKEKVEGLKVDLRDAVLAKEAAQQEVARLSKRLKDVQAAAAFFSNCAPASSSANRVQRPVKVALPRVTHHVQFATTMNAPTQVLSAIDVLQKQILRTKGKGHEKKGKGYLSR